LPFVEVKTARVLASTRTASDLTVIFIWLSLIEQGGVKVDGRTMEDVSTLLEFKEAAVMQVGKRRFVRVVRG
jgi:hypothetical protein